jgi:hypothetical protein
VSQSNSSTALLITLLGLLTQFEIVYAYTHHRNAPVENVSIARHASRVALTTAPSDRGWAKYLSIRTSTCE